MKKSNRVPSNYKYTRVKPLDDTFDHPMGKQEKGKNRRVTREGYLHPGARYRRGGGGGDHQRPQDQEWTIAAHRHPSPSPLQASEEIGNLILRVFAKRGGVLIASLERPPAQS